MRHERRRDVQGLRAIAVTAVVCFHAGWPLSGGFTGVDVFFVISGFVIALTLLREWNKTGHINLPQFYLRRFKRLAPALSLVVAVTMAFGFLFLSPLGSQVKVTALTGIGAVLMAANGVIATQTGGYFQIAAADNPLLNTWSLSVEEQFYILFPSALFLALLIRNRSAMGKLAPLAMIVAIAALSLLGVVQFVRGHVTPRTEFILGFYSPATRAWEFAAGAVLALVVPTGARSPRTATIATVVGALLLCVSFLFITSKTVFPGPMTLLPVAGTMALIWGGANARGPLSALIESRLFVYVGDISYSWYLWHWPAIVFAGTLYGSNSLVLTLAAVFSLLPALAAYHWVEMPLRRYQPPSRWKSARLILLTLSPTLAMCLLLNFANAHSYWSPPIASYQESVDRLHAGKEAGCGDGYVPASLQDRKCDFNAAGKNRPVYLIGDSNADHFSEAVITAATATNRPVKIITKGGCAFIGRSWSDASESDQAACRTFVDATRRLLADAPKGQVILGLSDSLWNFVVPVGPSPDQRYTTRAGVQKYLQDELTALVKEIRAEGHEVVLLQPVPKFIAKDHTLLFESVKCPTVDVLVGHCPHRVVVSQESEQELQQYARMAMIQAARDTGSPLLDFYSYLCPQGRCSNVSADGHILYRDPGHLTVEASRKLNVAFVPVLAQRPPEND